MHRGFTLIESVISIALVSLLVVGSLMALGASTRSQRLHLTGRRATSLAHDLMSEIMPLAYTDPDPGAVFGPEAGEGSGSRADWDDIDDFHGWSASPPQAPDGTPIVGADGWTRTVLIARVAPDAPDGPDRGSDDGLRRITVTVTPPGGAPASLVGLRARSGPIDATPEDVFALSWAGAELQVGHDDSARLASGTTLLNQAPPLPPNMLVNPGIEDGESPWWGDTCVLQVRGEPHRGLLSLRARTRAFAASGPAQNVAGLVNGATYDVEFRVRMHDGGNETAQIALLWFDGFELRSQVGGNTPIDGARWRPVRATFTPVWTGTLQWAYVKVQTTAGTRSLLIDDAVMREVPE